MIALRTEPLSARNFPLTAAPNKRWSPGRVCEVPGCGTRLSIYNRVAKCSVHEEVRVYQLRGKRRRRRAV